MRDWTRRRGKLHGRWRRRSGTGFPLARGLNLLIKSTSNEHKFVYDLTLVLGLYLSDVQMFLAWRIIDCIVLTTSPYHILPPGLRYFLCPYSGHIIVTTSASDSETMMYPVVFVKTCSCLLRINNAIVVVGN